MSLILLCDVDGVLIAKGRFEKALAKDKTIRHGAATDFFRRGLRECQLGKADLKETLGTQLPAWGWRRSVDDFLQYWFETDSELNEPLRMRLRSYRRLGVPCYLATMQERYRMAYIMDVLGLGADVVGAFPTWRIGHGKDSPIYYRSLLHQLPITDPRQALFFDDQQPNVAAARNAGLTAELFTTVDQFDEVVALHMRRW
ncbi:MAG TPA: hypothetical protein DEV93_14755 [Chloroflexi bacterium]|jgi:putative hydrolase of the HAD superfamily|nr:hypothetical protein [Chloroflexota bacterium]